jgi:hypothetical protein
LLPQQLNSTPEAGEADVEKGEDSAGEVFVKEALGEGRDFARRLRDSTIPTARM